MAGQGRTAFMAKTLLTSIFGSRNDRLLKQYRRTVERINAMEPQFEKLSDDELRGKTQEFKDRVAQGDALDDILADAFSVVRARARTMTRLFYPASIAWRGDALGSHNLLAIGVELGLMGLALWTIWIG